jgi:hypothetical protein
MPLLVHTPIADPIRSDSVVTMRLSVPRWINRTRFYETHRGDFCAVVDERSGWHLYHVTQDGLHHIAHVMTLRDGEGLIHTLLKE